MNAGADFYTDIFPLSFANYIQVSQCQLGTNSDLTVAQQAMMRSLRTRIELDLNELAPAIFCTNVFFVFCLFFLSFVAFASTDFSHKPTKSDVVKQKNTGLQGEKMEIFF